MTTKNTLLSLWAVLLAPVIQIAIGIISLDKNIDVKLVYGFITFNSVLFFGIIITISFLIRKLNQLENTHRNEMTELENRHRENITELENICEKKIEIEKNKLLSLCMEQFHDYIHTLRDNTISFFNNFDEKKYKVDNQRIFFEDVQTKMKDILNIIENFLCTILEKKKLAVCLKTIKNDTKKETINELSPNELEKLKLITISRSKGTEPSERKKCTQVTYLGDNSAALDMFKNKHDHWFVTNDIKTTNTINKSRWSNNYNSVMMAQIRFYENEKSDITGIFAIDSLEKHIFPTDETIQKNMVGLFADGLYFFSKLVQHLMVKLGYTKE